MKETKAILNVLAASWGFTDFNAWFVAHGSDQAKIESLFADAIELAKSE